MVIVGVRGVTKRKHFFIIPLRVASTLVLLGMPFIYNTWLYLEYNNITLDICTNIIFRSTRIIIKLRGKGLSRLGN